MNCIERCLKRTFDFTLALVSLVLFSPVMLVIAILIRREEPDGDVIYTQERVGYKGRPFKLYKFRSMYMDAEKDNAPQLYQEQDPRLTKIGAFIRAHHLDEFPQLWNVIKGDMSFVGPRPERQYFIDQISAVRPDYERLYALRPGLFSFATLYNGYTDTLEKMLRRLDLDIKYLENYSLWTDIKIIFLTSQSIIFGKKF
ncbi:sugar transferase [Porphyromonas sp. oral taxon 275]|uniref:sugar transferase n=1 Tax=Porphyromonas sp. oral taxon 275 TaxID=712435 RepID=UPI001BA4B2D0|nr:sugar transferase [Porphyromonas sp. oral taxon 275]QUB43091.1 sugar transferase [Porphyromonas sp. oral taxon 275]